MANGVHPMLEDSCSVVSRLPRRVWRGVCVAALLAIACWAYAPTGIRIALRSYTPSEVALLRFLVASLMFLGVASAKGVARVRPGDLGWIASLAWFGVAAHHLALNQGQQSVSAGAASCLAQTAPIFTVLLARPILGEIITTRHWAPEFDIFLRKPLICLYLGSRNWHYRAMSKGSRVGVSS